jgi:hypothetical protein
MTTEWEDNRAAQIDAYLARQLQRSIARNGRLVTALRRIKSLDPKNVEKYAQQIAAEALDEAGPDRYGILGNDGPLDDVRDPQHPGGRAHRGGEAETDSIG